jgi:hypothetical protein
MNAGLQPRVTCPSCGLARGFPVGRVPETLPHRCPRCGAELVADGLLVATKPAAALDPGPFAPTSTKARPESFFPAPQAREVIALAALLLWSLEKRGFLAAALAGADLVFHEAGHPLFGLFGWRFLMFLGGTIGQLTFPVAAAIGFARVRRTAPFAVALLWIGFNLVDIGRYAADASARVLPLLAPDEDSHDWWNMLGMLGVRDHCLGIGGTISAAGWLLWLGAPTWVAWRWWVDRVGRLNP